MATGRTRCNICGKELSEDAEKEHIGIHQKIGYGSNHDGETIDFDNCWECFDTIIEKYSKHCKISPILESNKSQTVLKNEKKNRFLDGLENKRKNRLSDALENFDNI